MKGNTSGRAAGQGVGFGGGPPADGGGYGGGPPADGGGYGGGPPADGGGYGGGPPADGGGYGGGPPADGGGFGGGSATRTSATQAAVSQGPAVKLGPAVIAHRRLPFRIQRQHQSEWCWAAVAVSVEQYFDPNSDPATRLTQCKVAERVLNDKDTMPHLKCCEDPEPCNLPAKLETALQKIYKWRNTLDGPLTFEQVQREIDRGRPVGVGITWASADGGGGHFVVVNGYRVLSSGAHQLYVADPLNPASALVDFNEFTLSYYGEGKWTTTDLVANDWS